MFANGGDAGGALSRVDWSRSAVGPVQDWPQSLSTAVSMTLHGRAPMYVAWGEDLIQFYNDAFAALMGSSRHPAALGRSARETFAEAWEVMRPLIETAMAGAPHELRDPHLPPLALHTPDVADGSWRLCSGPIRGEAADVRGVLVTAVPVLARSGGGPDEAFFRAMFDNLPELAWSARADGHIDYYNRRWYEYTGTTPAAAEGWGWSSAHHPEMIDAVLERWRHSINTGEPFEMEFPLRGADGEYRWFLTRVRPLRDGDGRIIRWFGSNTNIDERQRTEDFRDRFLGILGHDLRNPLSTILTTARVMIRRPDTPPEAHKRMKRIVTSGVRMQRMIEQLLDLTRARLAGGIPVTLSDEPVPLAPIALRIVSEVRAANPSSIIDLIAEGDCAARIDVDRFEQVLSNLVGNAATHGEITRPISVTLEATDEWTFIAVHNFGKPIDPSFMPQVFNSFARSEKPHGRSAGLGLGLYISERIIHAHGGRLTVTSAADEGTRFTISLPRARDE